MRTSPDVGAMSAAVSRPGIDPRVWLTLAVVSRVGFDADEGPFADVQYQPGGENETALIGSSYAGNEFGDWGDVAEGDTVLVAQPMGDPGNGPVIICRMWNAGDAPFSEMGDGDTPTTNRVIRVKPGSKFVVRTSGDGDGIDMRTGGDGIVGFQDASQAYVRGDDQKQALDAFLASFDTWIELVRLGIVAGGGTLDNTTITQASQTLRNGLANALSTKIKGE